MNIIYLLLGSNVGDRVKQLEKAKISIGSKIGKIIKQSRIYETEPWGEKEQADFLNQAISVETNLNPMQTLKKIKEIEKLLHRQETYKWGPREIDIDILFFGEVVMAKMKLTIPHPFIQERKFTLVPLAEIAPDLCHPILGCSVIDLLIECEDTGEVVEFKNL